MTSHIAAKPDLAVSPRANGRAHGKAELPSTRDEDAVAETPAGDGTTAEANGILEFGDWFGALEPKQAGAAPTATGDDPAPASVSATAKAAVDGAAADAGSRHTVFGPAARLAQRLLQLESVVPAVAARPDAVPQTDASVHAAAAGTETIRPSGRLDAAMEIGKTASLLSTSAPANEKVTLVALRTDFRPDTMADEGAGSQPASVVAGPKVAAAARSAVSVGAAVAAWADRDPSMNAARLDPVVGTAKVDAGPLSAPAQATGKGMPGVVRPAVRSDTVSDEGTDPRPLSVTRGTVAASPARIAAATLSARPAVEGRADRATMGTVARPEVAPETSKADVISKIDNAGSATPQVVEIDVPPEIGTVGTTQETGKPEAAIATGKAGALPLSTSAPAIGKVTPAVLPPDARPDAMAGIGADAEPLPVAIAPKVSTVAMAGARPVAAAASAGPAAAVRADPDPSAVAGPNRAEAMATTGKAEALPPPAAAPTAENITPAVPDGRTDGMAAKGTGSKPLPVASVTTAAPVAMAGARPAAAAVSAGPSVAVRAAHDPSVGPRRAEARNTTGAIEPARAAAPAGTEAVRSMAGAAPTTVSTPTSTDGSAITDELPAAPRSSSPDGIPGPVRATEPGGLPKADSAPMPPRTQASPKEPSVAFATGENDDVATADADRPASTAGQIASAIGGQLAGPTGAASGGAATNISTGAVTDPVLHGAPTQNLRLRAGGAALKTLQIQLQPTQMGTIDVTMKLVNGQLQVHLVASEAATALHLKDDKESLRSLLTKSGFDVDEAAITVAARDPGAVGPSQGSSPAARRAEGEATNSGGGSSGFSGQGTGENAGQGAARGTPRYAAAVDTNDPSAVGAEPVSRRHDGATTYL